MAIHIPSQSVPVWMVRCQQQSALQVEVGHRLRDYDVGYDSEAVESGKVTTSILLLPSSVPSSC